ncbi:cell division protein FtsB [Agitococcus lubricus]|uniref:Cell division protein FtsB n=1 Tax=Agitococcus lubricus TaxID=1077255 RepID=A0A2T5IWN9_9GAMM|nr:cell division protein FtsB [Agitococcus lubricus]PTQ88326.1 cell division protein FtsB [Agitococcus lubricus]
MLNSLFGRLLILMSALIFCTLQSLLWIGDGGLLDYQDLLRQIEQQKDENARLTERNQILQAEINDLKNGTESIEEHARLDLGMVKQGETFFRVVKATVVAPTPTEQTP